MTAIEYALTFLGTPYTWGGNTPGEGFDCSGFICEVLKSQDILKNHDDFTAQGLYYLFTANGKNSAIQEGSLIFYGGSENKITHVAMAINSSQIIEAAGEGRVSSDKGFVRIRKINYRSDLVAAIPVLQL